MSGTAPPGWLVWTNLAAIYLIWGSTYLAIRVMVETMPPLLSSGVRFFVAGLIFYAWLLATRGRARLRVSAGEVLAATLVGVALILGGNGLVSVAEQDVPSGLAALIIGSVPLWVVILRRAAGERVHRVTIVSILAGFVGLAILVLPGDRPDDASFVGLLLLVCAAISWATGSFLSTRLSLPGDPLLSTAVQMVCGGGIMALVGLGVGEGGEVDAGAFSHDSLIAFAYLIGAGSLVAFTAYVWLLQHVPISKVATYAYVNPIVAIFLGWAILSEEITATMIAGAAIIVGSVALVVRRESERPKEPLEPAPEPVRAS